MVGRPRRRDRGRASAPSGKDAASPAMLAKRLRARHPASAVFGRSHGSSHKPWPKRLGDGSKQERLRFLPPYLKEIIRLRKEESQILFSISEKASVTYDVLLDQYEPNATVDQIESVFSELKSPLVELVQRLLQATSQPSGEWVSKTFPIERQKELSRWIAQAIGFDFDRGRLDITEHPFCTTLGPSDHRILTRYSDHHFNSGFFGTLHEAGHGMYEQGLSTEWFGMPPGQYASLGVHESQSRLWENLVGRSYPFWKWCFPKVLEFFPESLKGCALEAFYADINRVSRSLIRVEADEATYNLHVMVRFELEKELFADALHPRIYPKLGIRNTSRILDCVLRTTRSGSCRMSTGVQGCSATSLPIRSETSTQLSCLKPPIEASARSTSSSLEGNSPLAAMASRAHPPAWTDLRTASVGRTSHRGEHFKSAASSLLGSQTLRHLLVAQRAELQNRNNRYLPGIAADSRYLRSEQHSASQPKS